MTILVSGVGFLCLVLGITAMDTQSNGFFTQERIGQHGKLFLIYKLRTLHAKTNKCSLWGRILRKTKFDELPQLLNILKGQMTFVGPRPDVPGYADVLVGADRTLLTLKPGVTGLASLKYRNEEKILSQQTHPQQYNDEVIWPDKVRINKWYVQNKNVLLDLKIIFHTLFSIPLDVDAFIGEKV